MGTLDALERILLRNAAAYAWSLIAIREERDKGLQAALIDDARGMAYILVGKAMNPAEDFIHANGQPVALLKDLLPRVTVRSALHLRSLDRETASVFGEHWTLVQDEDLLRFATRKPVQGATGTERVIPLGKEHAECFPGKFDGRFDGAAEWLKRLAEFAVVFGIVENGQIIAHAAVQEISPAVSEVRKVWTHPDCRERGLGKACVAVAAAECLKRSHCATYSVVAGNRASIALAKSCGFTPLPTTYRWRGKAPR